MQLGKYGARTIAALLLVIGECLLGQRSAFAQYNNLPINVTNFHVTLGSGASATLPMSPSNSVSADSYSWICNLVTSSLPQPLNFVGGGQSYAVVLEANYLDANQNIIGTFSGQEVYGPSFPVSPYQGNASSVPYQESFSYNPFATLVRSMELHNINATYLQYYIYISGGIGPEDIINGQPTTVSGGYTVDGGFVFVGYYMRPTNGWPAE